MEKIWEVFDRFEQWTLEKQERTWFSHGGLSILICIFVNPPAAITFYSIREGVQIYNNRRYFKNSWKDHIGDVLGSAIPSLLFWWIFLDMSFYVPWSVFVWWLMS